VKRGKAVATTRQTHCSFLKPGALQAHEERDVTQRRRRARGTFSGNRSEKREKIEKTTP